MLVLSRKVGERILVGNVWLTVLGVKGQRVRLGLVAPPDVVLAREELLPAPAAQPLPVAPPPAAN